MAKKFLCTECGATNVYKDIVSDKCNYCGAIIESQGSEIIVSNDVKQAALDATSFQKSLIVEINGQKASITDMWESLVSNRAKGQDSLIKFCRNLNVRIRFCIEAFQNLSDEAKYEVGDFICTQMESIMKFRVKHKVIYLDELDDINAMIEKQMYDLKGRGIFQFKAKSVIKKRIKRLQARRSVLNYDYVTQATKEIIEEYSPKIEAVTSELNATGKTALGRRRELKDKINALEVAKKNAITALGGVAITKEYNKVVKKFKINHVNNMTEILNEFTAFTPAPGKIKEAEKIDYSAMSDAEIIDTLISTIENLKKNVTRSEADKCKEVKAILESRAANFSEAARPYLNAVVMSVNMLFSNENPAVMSAMIGNLAGNIISQANTLKMNIAN